jgi:hypothetical protein
MEAKLVGQVEGSMEKPVSRLLLASKPAVLAVVLLVVAAASAVVLAAAVLAEAGRRLCRSWIC